MKKLALILAAVMVASCMMIVPTAATSGADVLASADMYLTFEGDSYADTKGNCGICPARKVQVLDTTGAGDAFCAGVAIGLTYGKALSEAVEIGTLLAASVITSKENVCPRFLPEELGLDPALI